MSASLPTPARGFEPDADHARLQQRPLSPAEQRARWEVHAAHWRARALAETVFGRVASSRLTGIRANGPLRGLVRLDVPVSDLTLQRDRESRFLAAVESDPLLSHIRLVYVFDAA